MLTRIFLGALLALVQTLCWGDEKDLREAQESAVTTAWRSEDFAQIEQAYSKAVRENLQTPAGRSHVSNMAVGLAKGMRALNGSENEAHWVAMEQRAARYRAAFPNSTFAVVAQARAYNAHAWGLRGDGFASSIPPDKWAPFYAKLQQAADSLTSAGQQVKRDPTWHAMRLYVGLKQPLSKQEFARLLADAVEQYPGDLDIYLAAVGGLLPRWGGSVEELDWLANVAAQKNKDQGQVMYARVYMHLGLNEFRSNDFFGTTMADWKRMKEGFDEFIKRRPDPWNLSSFAWAACEARDRAKLQELLARLGDGVNAKLWPSRQALAKCRAFARDGE